MKKLLILAMMVCFGLVVAPVGAQVKVEMWKPDPGTGQSDAFYTSAQTLTDVFTLPTFGLGKYNTADVDLNYTMREIGYIVIKKAGVYTFATSSDDGSFLWIGDWWTAMGITPDPVVSLGIVTSKPLTRVVNNDAYQGIVRVAGSYEFLTPGIYGIMVGYYQGTGGLGLSTDYNGPDTGYVLTSPIPANVLDAAKVLFPVIPADGAVNVRLGTELSWTPNALMTKDVSYNVLFGPGSGEPNMVKIYSGIKDLTKAPVPSPLASSKKYFWRVDVIDPNNGKPKTYKGVEWSFTTESGQPIIDKQPARAVVGADCLGQFTVIARSGADNNNGNLSYAWKRVGSTSVLGTQPTYNAIAFPGNLGMFYCEVTNTKGTTKSAEAELKVLPKGTSALTGVAIGTGVQAGVGVTLNSADSVTVTGSGDDIWNTADGFEYAYVQISGDFDIACRVSSFTTGNTDGWAKVGIMARQDLTVGSSHVLFGCAMAQGLTFQGRRDANTGNNGNFSGQNGFTGTYPYGKPQVWVRLTRVGNVFTPYSSTDGITWTLYPGNTTVGGEEIRSPWTRANIVDPIYIGFASGAHNTAYLATATFDNIVGIGSDWRVINPAYSNKTTEGWIDPVQNLTVSWTKAPLGPCGATTYKVYGGEDPQNLQLLADNLSTTQATIPSSILDFNKTYFWRVDTYYGGDSEQGNVWSFDTIKLLPTIKTQPEPITVVNAGAAVNLNVLAHTTMNTKTNSLVNMVKYEWFQGATKVFEGVPADDGKGNHDYNCPLVLSNVQLAKEGLYTCVVTSEGGTVTSNGARVLTHRLMVWLKFDDNINDSSASGFTPAFAPPTGKAPIINGYGTGMIGKAIDLSGPSTDPNRAFVNVGKTASELGISGKLPRTAAVWAFTRSYANGGLFDIGNYQNGEDFSLRTLDSTDNRWRIQYWGGDYDFTTTSKGVWTHFAHIFDGTVTRIVVNGVEVVSWTGPVMNTPDTLPLAVGVYGFNRNATPGPTFGWLFAGNVFDGLLDDFRLYNYALTSLEAAKLYTDVSLKTVCVKPLAQDLTGDCKVDLADFAEMAIRWLNSNVVGPK
jgi:hypothetical protein